MSKDLEAWTLAVLFRPPGAPDLPEAELDRLQDEHIAFLDEMRARGALAAAGPFAERPDESWRGLCLYRTGIDETRELAVLDPLVRAGRLVPTLLTWLVPVGELPLR